jgi:pimeloyl-ACP methyl ester carboxylesterase
MAREELQRGEMAPQQRRVTIDPQVEPQLQSGKTDVLLSDGVRLNIGVRERGKPDGWPIIFSHGTPGSSVGPVPRSIHLHRWGIRLISWDRPGYGDTERHEGRIVADSATRIEAIARAKGIQKCSVAGRSGGGPSTLAAAALLPDLIMNAGIFSSIAPKDAGLDWFAGMSAGNVAAYSSVRADRQELARHFAEVAELIRVDQQAVLKEIEPDMSVADLRYLGSVGMRRLIAESHADGLRHGSWGRYDDVVAAQEPWGFDPKDITAPVLVFQGGDDNFTAESHFKWLARNLPNVQPVYIPEMGHLETLSVALEGLSTLKTQAQQL